MIRVVDLGTKRAGALDEFLRAGPDYFKDAAGIKPGECLGVDLKPQYQADVEAKGYRFECFDVLEEPEKLPRADFYLAWDFLEHLPSVSLAGALLQYVLLLKARHAVWVRMPSFEDDDETGEGRLRKLGLRFAWTRWHGHKAHFTLADLHAAVDGHPRVVECTVRPNKKIHTTAHPNVVPINAPVDTVVYSTDLGARQEVVLGPPVVGQYDVLIRLC